MNVIQRPEAQSFCATMRDYIIDTDSTIKFAVSYGGGLILEEEYTPDKFQSTHLHEVRLLPIQMAENQSSARPFLRTLFA